MQARLRRVELTKLQWRIPSQQHLPINAINLHRVILFLQCIYTQPCLGRSQEIAEDLSWINRKRFIVSHLHHETVILHGLGETTRIKMMQSDF